MCIVLYVLRRLERPKLPPVCRRRPSNSHDSPPAEPGSAVPLPVSSSARLRLQNEGHKDEQTVPEDQPPPASRDSPQGLSFADWTALNSYSNLEDLTSLQRRRSGATTPSLEPLLEPDARHSRGHSAPALRGSTSSLDPAVAQAPSTGAVGDDAGHLGSTLQLRDAGLAAAAGSTTEQQQAQDSNARLARAHSNRFATSSSAFLESGQPMAGRQKRVLAPQNGTKLPINDSASSRPDVLMRRPSTAPSESAASAGSQGVGSQQQNPSIQRQASLHSPPLTSPGAGAFAATAARLDSHLQRCTTSLTIACIPWVLV